MPYKTINIDLTAAEDGKPDLALNALEEQGWSIHTVQTFDDTSFVALMEAPAPERTNAGYQPVKPARRPK